MKTVLVTGATGFIGSHLLPTLHQQGWQITAAIRKNSPLSSPSKTIQIGEVNGSTDWQEALLGIDAVIHLAARAHIIHDDAPNPEAEFTRVNIEGTANLVKQSIQAGVKHFVFISSIGAMCSFSDRILTENSPCQPDTPYGRSKLQAERALIDLARNSSMTWTILRPTLVYGPGNPGNMERLMKLVNKGLPLTFGAITNRRSFLFVDNLVDAIITCLNNPNAANELFLVSDGEDVSTPELVRRIAQQVDKPCQLLPISPSLLRLVGHLGDALQSLSGRSIPFNSYSFDRLLGSLYVDSTHIQKTLSWQPPFTLDQGLEQTLSSWEK